MRSSKREQTGLQYGAFRSAAQRIVLEGRALCFLRCNILARFSLLIAGPSLSNTSKKTSL
eukprot:1911638-Amphidinium_carterae.1